MVTTVMVEGWANVPTLNSIYGEGGSVGGCFMDYYFGASRSKGSSVEVEVSVDVCVCRNAWVCVARAKEVESDHG